MSQLAIYLLALNLWAVLVWAAASAFSRNAPGLAAWPGYWTGAVAVILAPWLAGFLVPDSALGLLGAGAGAAIDTLAETAPRAAGWAMEEAFAWAGMPVTETAAANATLASLPVLVDPAGVPVTDAIVAAGAPAAQDTPAALLPAAFAGPMTALAPAVEAATPWLSIFAVALVAIYGAGVAWTAGLRIGAHVRLRLLARGTPLPVAPGAAWPVYVAETSVPPCALGFPGRRILVPAHMLERIGEDELAMILRHESAHIDRGDPETTLALSLVDALFWPNPAVRALINRWRLAAEIRADQAVAAGQPQARRMAYARLLISALRTVRGAPLAAPSAALRLDQKGSVKMRLAAILDSGPRCGGFASRLLAATAGIAVAGAGALGCAAIAQAAPRPAQDAQLAQSLLPAPVAEPAPLAPLPAPAQDESEPAQQAAPDAAADPAPRAADAAPQAAPEAPVLLAQQDSPQPVFVTPPAPAAPPYPAAPEFTPDMSATERAQAMSEWRAERAEWEAAWDAEREAWETEREEALAEWRESYAEWEAERAERERERQRAQAEAHAERQQAIQEAQAERQRAQAERQRAIQEAQAERQRAIQEAQAEMEQARDEWAQEFGQDWAGDWSSAWSESWSWSWNDADAAALQAAVADVQDWAALGAEQGRIWGRYGARVGAIEGRYGGMMGRVGALQGRVGTLQGRLGALQGRRDVSEQERAELRAQLQEAQADLEEAHAELDEAMAERERDLAELERELRRDLAEIGAEAPAGFHSGYDYNYAVDPDGAAVSRILEGGPRE